MKEMPQFEYFFYAVLSALGIVFTLCHFLLHQKLVKEKDNRKDIFMGLFFMSFLVAAANIIEMVVCVLALDEITSQYLSFIISSLTVLAAGLFILLHLNIRSSQTNGKTKPVILLLLLAFSLVFLTLIYSFQTQSLGQWAGIFGNTFQSSGNSLSGWIRMAAVIALIVSGIVIGRKNFDGRKPVIIMFGIVTAAAITGYISLTGILKYYLLKESMALSVCFEGYFLSVFFIHHLWKSHLQKLSSQSNWTRRDEDRPLSHKKWSDFLDAVGQHLKALRNNYLKIQSIEKQSSVFLENERKMGRDSGSLIDSMIQWDDEYREEQLKLYQQRRKMLMEQQEWNEKIGLLNGRILRYLKESSFLMKDITAFITKAGNGKELIQENMVSINQISQSVGSLNMLVDLIHDISEQTTLLSINAAIEAYHAGSLGAGFSVVAEEIRQVALLTSKEAERIEKNIQDIKDKSLQEKAMNQELDDNYIHFSNTIEQLFISVLNMNQFYDDLKNYCGVLGNSCREKKVKMDIADEEWKGLDHPAAEDLVKNRLKDQEQTARGMEELFRLEKQLGLLINNIEKIYLPQN